MFKKHKNNVTITHKGEGCNGYNFCSNHNNVVVDYKTENTTSAYLMVLNATATTNNNYIINVNQTQANFNVTNYQQGTYSVILVCDGVAVDMKTLIVQ